MSSRSYGRRTKLTIIAGRMAWTRCCARSRLRGVKTRVMLNPARRSRESENVDTLRQLVAAGIEVKDTNPRRRTSNIRATTP